jgi:uncharacterized LabA/DUF88 family protein
MGNGRAMIFIDGSNLFGSMKDYDPSSPNRLDFEKLSEELVKSCHADSYEGTYYYCSYPPSLPGVTQAKGIEKLLKLFEAIEYKTGYTVKKSPRKIRETHCKQCSSKSQITVEKGTDSSLITDMLSLAWENAFDIAILVSDDSDFKPAVEFLRGKGKKVYHATFTSVKGGQALRKACFSQISLETILKTTLRPEVISSVNP